MTFTEMQNMYEEIVQRFSKIELQEWKAEGAMIELSKQVGELAKQVMIKEKYYALTGEVTDVDERLGNEMADVIAQVMRLAMYYNIDLEKYSVRTDLAFEALDLNRLEHFNEVVNEEYKENIEQTTQNKIEDEKFREFIEEVLKKDYKLRYDT